MTNSRRFDRRRFLQNSGLAAAAGALPLSALFERRAEAAGFGALKKDPKGIFNLPAGFSYRILETRGDKMTDGYRVPNAADGMACFRGPPGTFVLMRNHENNTTASSGPYFSGQAAPAEAYNKKAMGGVTRVVLDAKTFARKSSNLVLAGTKRNCAGGISPWGWLTCEETLAAGHGYVFLCKTDADKVQKPQRIDGYGRFNHEAAVVDPKTNIAYLTEDRIDGGFYRFVPKDKASPFIGQLQALRIKGKPRTVLGLRQPLKARFDIDWVDINTPTPSTDTVRTEGQGKGAALFARGEGLWRDGGSYYISCTAGGPRFAGQIFRLTPDAQNKGGVLELVAHSVDTQKLDMPDNITVAPWRDVYIAEDGRSDQLIRVLTPQGTMFDFGRNAKSTSELAGVCFSPDGRALFVNLQWDGLTLVVTGPFPKAAPPKPDAGVGTPDAGVSDGSTSGGDAAVPPPTDTGGGCS